MYWMVMQMVMMNKQQEINIVELVYLQRQAERSLQRNERHITCVCVYIVETLWLWSHSG